MKRIPELGLVFLVVGALAGPVGGTTAFADSSVAARPSGSAAVPVFSGRTLPSGKDNALPAGAISMPDAVDRALRHNPSLGSQEAQGQSSEEARKSARGAFGPKLGTTYSAAKQERKTSPALPSSSRPAENGTYTWAVEISQPVFQGFQLLANYQKAALQADSDKASVRNAELSMTMRPFSIT